MRLLGQTFNAPHRPLVTAAVLLSALLGSLTGAIDLFTLRVLNHPPPVEHAQVHALLQLFGFMWLFTMGISLTLAPRLLGAPQALPPSFAAWVTRGGIVGVLLLVAGRLGRLIPGSGWLGLIGASMVLVVMLRWAVFIVSLRPPTEIVQDHLPTVVKSGAGWWVLSAAWLFVWQLGQTAGGPISAFPLGPAVALALWGGTVSWLVGISFRAGACTMKSDRPALWRQRLAGLLIPLMALSQAGQALTFSPLTTLVAHGLTGLGLIALVTVVIRPPLMKPKGPPWREPQLGLVMRVGWGFAFVAGLLKLAEAGQPWSSGPALLSDVSRHALTIGWAMPLVFSFAGRMVPGFEATWLRWPGAYNLGFIALFAGALARATSLLPATGPSVRSAGLSGACAWLGVCLLGGALLATMRAGQQRERELLVVMSDAARTLR